MDNNENLEFRVSNIEKQIVKISNILEDVLFYLGYEKSLKELKNTNEIFKKTITK